MSIEIPSNVKGVLDGVADEQKRTDAINLIEIIHQKTGEQPYLSSSSIIGFGTYHYVYDSGREGDSPIIAFSPRKNALVLYGLVFYEERRDNLDKLGKHKAGKGCIYINSLSDVDEMVLRKMIKEAYLDKKPRP